jgi:Xaa-Pro aminopeptidase
MRSGILASFSSEEYSERIEKVKAKMSSAGIEVLVCSDPANMNYVTGYDGTSYYVHQLVLIILNYPSAIWIGRKMDAEGARITTFLSDENILYYSEDYIDPISLANTNHNLLFTLGFRY